MTFSFEEMKLLSPDWLGSLLISSTICDKSDKEGGLSANVIAWFSRLIWEGCSAIFLQSWFIFGFIIYFKEIINEKLSIFNIFAY